MFPLNPLTIAIIVVVVLVVLFSVTCIKIVPQAQAAKTNEHANYQVREADRKSWGHWYSAAPYYWHWRGSRWYLP